MPRLLMTNESNWDRFIKTHNQRLNCYTTVYDFEEFKEKRDNHGRLVSEAVLDSVILDRVFLDFDAHGDVPFEHAKEDMELVLEAMDGQLTYEAFLSGNGFHVFVYGHRADNIRQIQGFFNQMLCFTKHGTLDKTGVQTRRLRRIPDTMNMKSGSFCRLIKRNDAELVEWFDVPSFEESPVTIVEVENIGDIPILPCLKNAVMVENPSHEARYYLVQWYAEYLRNLGLDKSSIIENVCKEIDTVASHDGVWLDYNPSVTRHHVEFTVGKEYSAPWCKTSLIPKGYCIGKCWRYPE
jgi:hypothetical protein